MQIKRDIPRILETWLEFINAYERAAAETDDTLPGPSLQMLSAFAGAFVAGLCGGVADPGSGGTRVALPDGRCALIAVASDDRGDDFGMVVDPERVVADWVVLVVFRTLRPVAVHVIEARQLAGLSRVLRVQGPLPPNAPPSAMLLSTAVAFAHRQRFHSARARWGAGRYAAAGVEPSAQRIGIRRRVWPMIPESVGRSATDAGNGQYSADSISAKSSSGI